MTITVKAALAIGLISAGSLAGIATANASSDVSALLTSPANTQSTDGPEAIHDNGTQDNGTHAHYLVNGSPVDVMNTYKSTLESRGWTLTLQKSGGSHGGGGATLVGTNGTAYGVFTGGGYGHTTDVNACAWPTKPANTNCGDDD